MHSSTFSAAGMSSSSSPHHGHGPSAWGSSSTTSPLTTSLSDTLSQSRTQYQSGYMMSASQGNTTTPSSQRADETPLVKSKAKINHVLFRGSASDFGMDSMFESSRQRHRQTLTDDDAPPKLSANDIPNEFHVDPPRFQPRTASLDSTSFQRRQPRPPSTPQQSQTLYVIVFGYPPDKYTLTVEYFKSLGQTTDAELNTEITNCFKIGYLDGGDAMRAVRKNGEVIRGSWMIGVKWADPAQAETLLGQGVRGSTFNIAQPDTAQTPSNSMVIDESPSSNRLRGAASTPTVGTPIKLAPSAAAFRKPGTSEKVPASHQQHVPVTNQAAGPGTPGGGSLGIGQSPSRGMMGQVSDLIFGW